MSLNLRSLALFASAPYGASTAAASKVNFHVYGTADALATMLAAGYFNGASDKLKVGDIIFAVAGAGTAGVELITLRVSAVSSGSVTVVADLDEAAGSDRAVTSTADGLTTGLLAAGDTFVTVTSAGANNIVTLPAIADVPLGKEIWGKNGGTAFEMRTPSASTTKINGGDAHSNESVVAANATFLAKKVAADEWTLVTYAPGAVAVPVPD